jgi:hypothetical protein
MEEEMGVIIFQWSLISLELLFASSHGLALAEPFHKLVLQAGFDEVEIRKIGWFIAVLSGSLFMLFFLISLSI